MEGVKNEEKISLIRDCISQLDTIRVEQLILENKYKDETQYWELISLLGEAVNEDNFNKNPGFVDVCERCMSYIVNVGNGEELLYALLEQADSFNDLIKFKTFLGLIKTCILEVPSKLLFSIELSLVTLSDCICSLDIPNNDDDENEEVSEKRSEELDPEVVKAEQAVEAYIDFIAALVDVCLNTSDDGQKSRDMVACQEILIKYLLRVLEHPIALLDITVKQGHNGMTVKPDAHVLAERLVLLLGRMKGNMYKLVDEALKQNELTARKKRLLKFQKQSEPIEDLEMISPIALGCLSYLVHVENIGFHKTPSLMPRQALFDINLPLIQALVGRRETGIRQKGVALLSFFFTLIETDNIVLEFTDLERPEFYAILGSLFDIMIHCSSKPLRQQCVGLVSLLMQLFNVKARYQMFVKLFGTLKHSGAVGYCVQLLKAQIDQCLESRGDGNQEAIDEYFSGLSLKRLFLLFTKLEEKAATDFVENSDRIISALNLIRYLALRDPPCRNVTGVWSYMLELERDFMNELMTGLDLSKGHYQMELSPLEGRSKSKADSEEYVEMSVSVAGFKMPGMARGQKIAILKQALNTLDLIKCLVVRVNEVIEQQKKK